MASNNRGKGVLVYFVTAMVLLLVFVWYLSSAGNGNSKYTYSQIISYFDNLQVTEYTFDLGDGELKMIVKNDDGTTEKIVYTVPNVSVFLQDTQSESANYRAEYNKANPDNPLKQDYYKITDNSWLYTVLPTIVLIIMVIVVFVVMMRSAGGGKYTNFGKANIKNQMHNGKKTTFEDVAGADEEKAELAEIVDFLKNPKKYSDIGARIPKGVLLLGPPGTGKTLLARAVAGEAGCPFFSISGSDFVEMFVGVGASRVRDLFEQAKKNSPAIIFIDEIDAVGRHRGAGLGGGHDEREQTLNQLLVEMDGFTGNENIIVIAATNRRDILDPALLRPGRFDRQIVVGYPNVKGREEILKIHTKNKPLAPDVNLKTVAQTTVGFTGADLENLANEAALLAARANRKAITKEDIEESAIKVIAGPEKKSKVVTEKEKRLTAYHEGGHAIVTYFCDMQDKVHQISIIPRGMAGGYTMSLPENDKSFVSKQEMSQDIITLLGGRCAEALILDDISTGASNDIERATNTARAMVTRYGFSEKLGPVVYGTDQNEVFLGRDLGNTRNYSETVAAEIDTEIRTIIDNAYEKAVSILREHIDKLHFVAEYLMKFEKMDGSTFADVMSDKVGREILGTDQAESDN